MLYFGTITLAYYGVDYWIKKGLDPETAELRSKGLGKCVICGQHTKWKKSFNAVTAQVVCSSVCQSRATARRIDRYKTTCSQRKTCEFCGSPMSMKASLRQKRYICSEPCLLEYTASLSDRISPVSAAYWTQKGMSDEEAKAHVSALQRRRSPTSIDYWVDKGLSLEDAAGKVREHQKHVAAQVANMPVHKRKSRSRFCKEYWVARGCGIVTPEGDHIASIEGFVKRYGEALGERRYAEFLSQAQNKPDSLEAFVRELGVEKALRKWNAVSCGAGASKYGKRLFQALCDRIKLPSDVPAYFSSDDRKEYMELLPNGNYRFYDFVIPSLKLCIELHGVYWHADPSKYRSGDVVRRGGREVLVDDIWRRDQEKQGYLEEKGFSVYTLWYSSRDSEFDALLSYCVDIVETHCIMYGVNYEKIEHS